MIPEGDGGEVVRYRHEGPLSTLGDGLATRSVWNRLMDDGVPYRLWCVGDRSPFGYQEPFTERGLATVMAWSLSAGWLNGPMDGRPPRGRVVFPCERGTDLEVTDGAELAMASLLGIDGEIVPCQASDARLGLRAGCVAEWRP